MKTTSLAAGIFTIFSMMIATSVSAAVIGPGSGVVTIDPDTAIVDNLGTWSIVYDAEDLFTNGTIVITIPDGWTSPQDSDPTSPGYVTVSSDHAAANPTLAIADRVITITVVDLPKSKIVTLVYGDDSGGANPGARALPPTTADPSVEFPVESDPTGTTTVPLILGPPTIDLRGGPITHLVFTNVAFVFNTVTEAGPYWVEARDVYDNPSQVYADQQIDLSSTSGVGLFSELGGASFSPVTEVTMTVGSSNVSFYYRDTKVGTPSISASGNGQPWTSDSQVQQVDPGPPAELELSPADTTLTAGDFMTITIGVIDAVGARSPVTQERTLLLSSSAAAAVSGAEAAPAQSSGEFFLPGDHSTPITEATIPALEESIQVDYRNTDANGGDPHLIIILTNDGLQPSLSGMTTVTVQPNGISASASTVVAESPVTADGSDFSLVTVTVTDEFGNPIEGATVDLTPSGSNASETDPGPTLPDGTTTGQVVNTVAETVTVSATANGQPLDDTPQIVFEAGPVDAGTSAVDATTPVLADGVTTSTITVTARDANNNPVGFATVVLDVTPSGTGEVLGQPGGVTDPSGEAEGTLRSPNVGTYTVTATINGTPVTDDATVDFVTGPAAEFVWSHDGTATAGSPEPVTLEVIDAQGHRVEDYTGNVMLSTTKTGGVEQWTPSGTAQGSVSQNSGDWYYQFDINDDGIVQLFVSVTRSESIV
ncbi:MAG: Ig-like domain-containing protein, partial [Candidatus Latescibacterota bacterium]